MLERFRRGKLSADEVLTVLRRLPFEEMGFAKVDHHRGLRCGFPEVVFCPGKSPDQVTAIVRSILTAGQNVLATRVPEAVREELEADFPEGEFNEQARTFVVVKTPCEALPGKVVIVSAGTSDMPVAEEARVTAELMGAEVQTIYDAGVAGLHRLLKFHDDLQNATVVVVVAGMEGALASVVGGLIGAPVIAVPTSVGYGASLGGIAPLLTMLNSCAAGVSVVNIDNGFGAGYTAALICAVARKMKTS